MELAAVVQATTDTMNCTTATVDTASAGGGAATAIALANASKNAFGATPKPVQVSTRTQSTFAVGPKLKDTGTITRDDFDGGPVSLDEIEPGLYLGNLTAATSWDTLRAFKITHILTLDSIPLPKLIMEASFLTAKYIHIADMPKEDLLHHLDECVDFISDALDKGGHILVHCYFGVSRSSSAVIAYIMKRHDLDYQQAFELVRSKRRFVQPNAGFVAQLKLYRRMGCKIDTNYQKYKMYRLRLAGEQLRKVKILPQNFHNVIRSDPAITQENPEPIVYRCRRCRRILVSKSHVLLHPNKGQQQQQQQQHLLLQKQQGASNSVINLATTVQSNPVNSNTAGTGTGTGIGTTPRLLEQIAEQIRKASLGSPTTPATLNDAPHLDGDGIGGGVIDSFAMCHQILFVEPIAWMKNILHNTQGRINCPKCEQKLGNFSWINGCQCPCGEEVSPAFYLIPSKIELSKAVQNVQTTV